VRDRHSAFRGQRATPQTTKTKENTMNALDIVTKLDQEICGGELAKAASYLTEDFRFVGVGPEALNKDQALGVWATIRAGLPDFSHRMRNLRAAFNVVYGTVEAGGTHTGTLSIPNGPTVPATQRRWQNPLERIAITVRDGKVKEWAVESVPGGGLAGLLGQLT
jgi:SnoaL-like domain